MLTQSQQKKMNRICEDSIELLNSNQKASVVLKKTINDVTGPFMEFKMSGKPPSIATLEYVATTLLAVVLASTPEQQKDAGV